MKRPRQALSTKRFSWIDLMIIIMVGDVVSWFLR